MKKGLMKVKAFWFSWVLIGLSFVTLFQTATASDYPARPITLVIQFVAGTTTDIIMRRLSEVVSKDLGQPIIPVNKTGGGGTIGVAEIVRSKPDGYTIGCINMPALNIIPHIQTLAYDPFKDIAQVCVVNAYEYALYTKTDSPWNSFEDFVEYTRKNPGKATYATPGVGTTSHLLMVILGKDLNVDWRHVPYKGDGEIIPAILGGHVDTAIGSPAAVMPQVKAKKMKLLAITSKDRWSYVPEIPTLLEKGYKYQSSYNSLGVHAATPEPIRSKLEETFKRALQDPALKKEFEEKLSTKLTYISGSEYTKFAMEQSGVYREVLKSLGMVK